MSAKKYIGAGLAVILLAAAGGYTYLWHHFADDTKKILQQQLAKLPQMQKPESGIQSQLEVGEITVTGFPFQFNVNAASLKASFQMTKPEKQDFTLSFKQQVTLGMDVFGKELRLILPRQIDVTSPRIQDLQKMRDESTAPLVIRMELAKSPAAFYLSSGDPYPWNDERILNYFQKISFNDVGGKVLMADSGKPVMSYGNSSFLLQMDDVGGGIKHVRFMLGMDKMQPLEGYPEHYMKVMQGFNADPALTPEMKAMMDYLGKFEQSAGLQGFQSDISFTGPTSPKDIKPGALPPMELLVSKIHAENRVYSYDITGKISTDKDEPMPYGSMRIIIKDYPQFLNYYVTLLNLVIQGAVTEISKQTEAQGGNINPTDQKVVAMLKPIDQQMVDTIRNFLPKIAEISGDGKDMTLWLQREKKNQFYIGKLTVPDAVKAYISLAAPPPQIPSTIPSPDQQQPGIQMQQPQPGIQQVPMQQPLSPQMQIKVPPQQPGNPQQPRVPRQPSAPMQPGVPAQPGRPPQPTLQQNPPQIMPQPEGNSLPPRGSLPAGTSPQQMNIPDTGAPDAGASAVPLPSAAQPGNAGHGANPAPQSAVQPVQQQQPEAVPQQPAENPLPTGNNPLPEVPQIPGTQQPFITPGTMPPSN